MQTSIQFTFGFGFGFDYYTVAQMSCLWGAGISQKLSATGELTFSFVLIPFGGFYWRLTYHRWALRQVKLRSAIFKGDDRFSSSAFLSFDANHDQGYFNGPVVDSYEVSAGGPTYQRIPPP